MDLFICKHHPQIYHQRIRGRRTVSQKHKVTAPPSHQHDQSRAEHDDQDRGPGLQTERHLHDQRGHGLGQRPEPLPHGPVPTHGQEFRNAPGL